MLLNKKNIKKILKIFSLQLNFKKNRGRINKIDFLELKTLFFFSNKNNNLQKLFLKSICIEFNQESNFLDNAKYTSSSIIKSNAELYFLDNTTSKKCLNSKIDTKFIAIPLSAILLSFFNVLNLLKTRKFLFLGVKRFNKFYFIIEKLSYLPIDKRTRRYIPQNYNRLLLLKKLKDKSLNTVLLRWFDNLDSFEGNILEDIDILVDDKDLENLNEILNEDVGIFPLDIYSVSGLPNSAYAGLPYYPYQLAKNILATKVEHKQGFFIPNTTNYLLSLSYHAVFHKSVKSGIPILGKVDNDNGIIDHNYLDILKLAFLKDSESIKEFTLIDLYNFLEKKNVTPSYDLLLKLSILKNNDKWYTYLKEKYENLILADFKKITGLSVFIIRKKAFNEMKLDEVIKIIDSFGFEILDNNVINKEVFVNVRSNIRGGNWGKGPFKISGGEPVYYFVTFDPFYVNPTNKDLKQYPNLENRKITKLKIELRNYFNKNSEIKFNGVHSSDNFFESIDYLEHIYRNNNKINLLIENCIKIKKEYKTDYQVVIDLSRNSNRAKVELIIYDNKKAIKKTFKKNKLKFLQREVFFLNSFSEEDTIPNLYFIKDNYIIMEYFDDAVNLYNYKKITPRLILQLRKILFKIYNKNITILDINPSNVLVVNNKIKLIDFEFTNYYKVKPNSISESYELSFIPSGFEGDIPKGHKEIKDNYIFFWKSKLKLTKNQFVSINNKFILYLLIKLNYFVFKFIK